LRILAFSTFKIGPNCREKVSQPICRKDDLSPKFQHKKIDLPVEILKRILTLLLQEAQIGVDNFFHGVMLLAYFSDIAR
jgi:hypothetical protein